MRRRRDKRGAAAEGFTLVEIMAALAILGTALFVLLQAHYGTLRLFDAAREEVQFTEMLERATGIAKLETAAGNLSGSDTMGKRYPGYAYRFEAAAMDDTRPELLELLVEVEGPTETRQVRLLLFLPSPG